MKKSRKVNGYKITVEAWSNKVKVIDIKTKKIVKELVFSNHVQAALAVDKL